MKKFFEHFWRRRQQRNHRIRKSVNHPAAGHKPFTLRLCLSRDLRLLHYWRTSSNWSKQTFELLPENTNAYAIKITGNVLDVSKKKLAQDIGCSSGRDLWAICETESRYAFVADMSINKFRNIVSLQHCVNNIWKNRLWLASFCENCLNSFLIISI